MDLNYVNVKLVCKNNFDRVTQDYDCALMHPLYTSKGGQTKISTRMNKIRKYPQVRNFKL